MTLITTLSPFLVALITKYVKSLDSIKLSKFKKTITRFIVAVLSFGAVILTAILTDGEVDAISIESFADSLLTFLEATGIYFLVKPKKD